MSERGAWGPLLRRYRDRAGRTQANVAYKAGIAPGSLAAYENGHSKPSHGTAAAICAACDCTPEEAAALLETLDAAKAAEGKPAIAVVALAQAQAAPEPVVRLVRRLGAEVFSAPVRPPVVVAEREERAHWMTAPLKRREVAYCEACGAAITVTVTRLGEAGYAETVLLRCAEFAREHNEHGEVVVQRLVWPRATRQPEATK